ncbi:MAG: bile acid:sodium symporter family protein [Candidatus Methylacidiphilales bacterium]|nr:bile acid:sodium symporter family protein [Candidatus Methylacidiphilales bacterium]
MTTPPAEASASPASSSASNTTPRPAPSWWRANGFIIGLICAVIVAFILPGPGSRNGILHADILNNAGIALILFLQGLSLAFEKIKEGAGNWRLHLIIQSFTFLVFPLAGLGLDFIIPYLWHTEPQAIRDGFLYLCVLPSTVSTSVVLTAVAGGNTPGALFNAAVSNILGVVATPVLVHMLMATTGNSAPFLPLLAKITALTLVPFAIGMMLRPSIAAWVDARKVWVTRISNTVILFIVYSAFCESVEEKIWHKFGILLTLQVLAVVLFLFAAMSLLIYGSCSLLRLPRGDAIAAYFCSIKKTLAMGVPLAMLIFGERADLTLILLPIMFYHPVQLFINGLLANQWAPRDGQLQL